MEWTAKFLLFELDYTPHVEHYRRYFFPYKLHCTFNLSPQRGTSERRIRSAQSVLGVANHMDFCFNFYKTKAILFPSKAIIFI